MPYVNTVPAGTAGPCSRGDLAIEEKLASAHALERAGDGGARQQPPTRTRRPHRQLRQRRPTCSRWASTISSGRATQRKAATSCFFQPHSAPGVYARGPSSKGGLYRAGPGPLPAGDHAPAQGARGLSSYPHPWLMPDFWQFPPARWASARSARSTTRASCATSPTAAAGLRGPQGLGRVRRRRDGRAGEHERAHARLAREAGQPGVGGQLQPAAPRRARCAATAASSTSWRSCSAAPAGT
jgi:hypothetical protein